MILFWGIFYTLVRLLNQIVCLSVCLHIQLFLKVMQKLLRGVLEWYRPGGPNGQNYFHICHSRQWRAVLSFVLPIFVYGFSFWCPSIYWEPLNWIKLCFYWCSWYYSEGYLIKETFLQHLPFRWEPFWGILGPILGHTLLFLTAVHHLILWSSVQIFFVLLWQSIC